MKGWPPEDPLDERTASILAHLHEIDIRSGWVGEIDDLETLDPGPVRRLHLRLLHRTSPPVRRSDRWVWWHASDWTGSIVVGFDADDAVWLARAAMVRVDGGCLRVDDHRRWIEAGPGCVRHLKGFQSPLGPNHGRGWHRGDPPPHRSM